MTSPIQAGTPIERRRATVQRLDQFTVKLQRVTGFIQVNGAGEAIQDVTFPVTFAEKPGMSFGADLADNQPMAFGSLPTCSVVVYKWQAQLNVGKYMYTGATLAIVTTGLDSQIMNVHWHAEGRAFRNPVASNPQ